MARSVNFVKKFLNENRVLLSYIYDENGFKRGVALAISPTQVGWSLVSNEDYIPYTGRLKDIPAVQRIVQVNELAVAAGTVSAAGLAEEIFSLPAFATIGRLPQASKGAAIPARLLLVQKPNFDKYTGIAIALRRALRDSGEESILPEDANAIAAIANVARRAESFFA